MLRRKVETLPGKKVRTKRHPAGSRAACRDQQKTVVVLEIYNSLIQYQPWMLKSLRTGKRFFPKSSKTLFPRTHRLRTARIRFPPDIPQRKQHFSCLRQMPVRQTQSGNHRTGPLSRRRTGQRTLFLRGGRRAVPTLAAEHLPGSSRRHRLADSHERQPRPLGRTGRAATQCRADGPGARSGLPRRTRLGNFHRCGRAGHRTAQARHRLHAVGSYAQRKGAIADPQRNCILKAVHPSPLSAYRGFFGSKHFSRANEYLQSIGKAPILW